MEGLGHRLPQMSCPPPGPASAQWVETLARTECPAFTTRRARRAERSGAPRDPIVWVEARGANVVDADGNIYVDLTGGFGAAAVGHAHPRIVEAVERQARTLPHALGDVYPSDVKVRLLERLASLAPWSDARVILGLNGADAVEAALKTALLATGRPGVLAFHGGYHGLAHGPLAACGYGDAFRRPFLEQLNPHVTFAPFPDGGEVGAAIDRVRAAWPERDPGLVIVEPIQGRGGVVVPPAGFLAELAELCRDRGALLVADEVLVGLGRCGSLWRSVADGCVPDLLCAGKALGGGYPVSACLGRAEVMAAWGDPAGEAIHTGTFFGHPVGCAAALAALDIVEEEDLAARASASGEHVRHRLEDLSERSPRLGRVRGEGLLIGLELGASEVTLRVQHELLTRGYLVLPAGPSAEVLQISPPLMVDLPLLDGFVDSLASILGEVG